MNPFYPLVADRARHRCEYCRAPEVIFNFPFEVEHILSRNLNGPDQIDNLALSCRSCNIFKSDCQETADPETQEKVKLFNPRLHSWSEHFQLMSNGEIKGLNPIGRATVARLRINADLQVAARQQWINLGIYEYLE